MNIRFQSNRGSVVLVALCLSMAMAIAAAAYVYLAVGTYKRANRSFYYNASADMAEAGIEEALWALNNSSNWTQNPLWTTSGSDKVLHGSSKPVTDSSGVPAYFNVYVANFASGQPTITAEAVVSPPNSQVIRKQIRVYTKTVNLFMPPFTAINKMKLNGGQFDSYLEASGTYKTAARRYNTTLGSLEVDIGDLTIGAPADIYGHVETGVDSSQSAAFINNILGSVTSATTTVGANGVYKQGSNLIDSGQIAYDFSQDYPAQSYPSDAGLTVKYSLGSLDALGRYVLGTSGATSPTVYKITGDVTGSIVVQGPVYLEISGKLSISGSDAITVMQTTQTVTQKKGSTTLTATYSGDTNTKLELYVAGDIAISGNGTVLSSASDPNALKVYAMGTYGQKVSIGGNGDLVAAVYAPKADVTFNGGGSSGYFAGGVVGYNITVNGSGYRVRYPEEMANSPTGTAVKISKWIELTDPSGWHTF
jgi:hypothetical protein